MFHVKQRKIYEKIKQKNFYLLFKKIVCELTMLHEKRKEFFLNNHYMDRLASFT